MGPDFGPSSFNSRMGVTATGARQILIAYNVNLDTDDKAKANTIASSIRTSGSLVKDEQGQKIIGEDGKPKENPASSNHYRLPVGCTMNLQHKYP